MHHLSINLKLRHIFYFFLFAAISPCVLALQYKKNLQVDRSSSNGILFSIEKNGQRSYLLGTIHAGFSERQVLGENILGVLSMVDDVYLEADISNEQRTSDLIDAYGFDPHGVGLRKIIGSDEFDVFSQYAVDQYRLFTAEQFEYVRPWMLAMLLPVANRQGDEIVNLQWGTEFQLTDYARKHGLPIFEIEGLAHQFEVYNSMSERQQKDYFLSYVRSVRQHYAYDSQARDIKAWTTSSYTDLEKAWADRKKRTDFYSVFHTSMIVEGRNAYFFQKIGLALGDKKTHLFAVGEQHLVGERSLIKKLQEQGFKVTLCMPAKTCGIPKGVLSKTYEKSGR